MVLWGEMRCKNCGTIYGKPNPGEYIPPGQPPQTAPLPQMNQYRNPYQVEMPSIMPPKPQTPVEQPIKQEDDGRCTLGAHICKHCNQAFLVSKKDTASDEKVKAK